MLTLFYASATLLQGWRIKNVCNKITEQLIQPSSISFYALPAASDDGYDVTLATSDRCLNRSATRVTEILWLHGNQRGCCLRPMQKISILPWITFPQEHPIWLPFEHLHTPEELVTRLAQRKDLLYLLLELDVQPCHADGRDADIVRIEDYGKLIAWKIDSNIAVLLETDIEHYTKFLITTFLQNNLLVNDQLPLLRIESIQYDGTPQPFELVSNHLRKCTRNTAELDEEEWAKHLEDLRALCVLSNQAIEYEYNKNRTEGKTGIIKPDLIPAEKRQKADPTTITTTTIPVADAASTTETETEMSKMNTEIGLPQSKTETDTKIKPKTEEKISTKDHEKASSPSKNVERVSAKDVLDRATPLNVKESKAELLSGENSLATQTSKIIQAEADSTAKTLSLSKMKTKPTEVRKPGASMLDSSKFQNKKATADSDKDTSQVISAIAAVAPTPTTPSATVSSSSSITATAPESEKSELEKLAAATAGAAQKQKIISPASTAITTVDVSTKATTMPTQKPAGPVQSTTGTVIADSSVTSNNLNSVNGTSSIDKQKRELITAGSVVKDAVNSKTIDAAPIPTASKTSSTPTKSAVTAADADSTLSVSKDKAKRPSLRRNKDSLRESKPLNILVYSESASTREGAVATLKDILETDMYTIYPITPQQVEQKYWLENTALMVVCGGVASNIGEILVDYFLCGGKVLSLCSDILHFILPTYRTAEVREHELVQFSYDKWHKVKMMHHIFCYQPSPVKKHFSTDSDDAANSKKPALVCPRSIELKDLHGELHTLDVKVLGTEETWNTPSLLLANSIKSGGKAVFSQVHLETSPNQFETDETKYNILKQNERIRLEILSDLLNKHLQVDIKHEKDKVADADTSKKCIYQNAYFLGRYESKAELLEKLKEQTGTDKKLTTSKLIMKFCGKDDTPLHANTNVLPILIHSCPDDFSTVEYFDDLKTREIGRLVIYAPVVSSSMNVISELELVHGIAVIPRQQTDGYGRGNNQWLSPQGCAMFSIQLHISIDSPLGSRLPLIQHIIGAAIANSLKSHADYRILDIGVKWPNDIYANGLIKIGGLIVKTTITGNKAIVNVGCGINLDNSKPTHCVNDLISEYNRVNHHNVPLLKYEQFIAIMFNEIERLIDEAQAGNFESFYKLYYDLWLHNNQTVTIVDENGTTREAKVEGIDDYGYLKVKLSSGQIEIVQPDGNSFDMLKGLIVPK